MAEIQLDNRGLEAPDPLIRTLDSLDSLGHGDLLVVLMDREPLLLYPILERRGFDWTAEEQDGGQYRIAIQRASF